MRRGLIGVVSFLALVLTACGGSTSSDDIETPATDQPEASSEKEPESGSTSTTEAPEMTEDPANDLEEGTGTATIGDNSWVFALSGGGAEICNPNQSGVFFVNMFAEDGSVVLSVQAPASGGEAIVQAGDPNISGELWKADLNVYADNASVEGIPAGVGATAQVNGNSISGTGTFYEDRALYEARTGQTPYEAGVLEGTFEVTCPSG